MRPAEKWNKNPRNSKKRQAKKDSLQSDMAEPQSDYPQSGFWTDAMQPDETNEEREKVSEEPEDSDESQMRPPPVANRPRASSMQGQSRPAADQDQWNAATLDAALHRAIQSSPARFLGTQESPIELEDDLTPKPTRRLLFPSPRKDGETKSLDDSCIPRSTGKQPGGKTTTSLKDPFQSTTDKENLPPFDIDDDFSHLFEGSPSALFKTPAKYTPKKTPTSKSTAQFETLLATPTPSRRNISGGAVTTRTPNRGQDPFLPTFSSSETRNLFPVTPSRNISNSSITSPSPSREIMTPFTRHLTQLLNETSSTNGDMQGLGMNFGLHVTSSSSRVASNALFGTPDKHGFDFSDMPTFMTPGRDYGFDFSDLQAFETQPEAQTAMTEKEAVVVEEQAQSSVVSEEVAA